MLESLLIQIIVTMHEQTERPGWAAIFCPVCRDLRPAAAVRTRQTLVILMGMFTRIWTSRTDLTCPVCSATYRRAWEHPCREADAAAQSVDDIPDPLDLLADVDEDALAELNLRLDLEDRRIHRRLSTSEREQLLAEPFIELEHMGTDGGRMNIPTLTGFAIIGLVLGIPATIIIALSARGWVAPFVAILLCLVLIAFIVYDLGVRSRWRRSDSVYRLLARSLSPLEPSDDELRQVLTTLRVRRAGDAGRFRPAAIRRELNRLARQSLLPQRPTQPAARA